MTDARDVGRRAADRVLLAVVAVLVAVGLVLVAAGLQPSSPPPIAPAAPALTGERGEAAATARRVDGPPASTARLAASPPSEIVIPSIGVSSRVNPVGLNPDRTLEVPAPGPLYDQAAWYRGSVTPGEVGPSVIIGHVDSAANGPSVFYRLGELRPGSTLTVARADGSTPSFRVDDVRRFSKRDFPTRTVYGPTDRPELRLITCSGDFDPRTGSYRDNTVVFARLVA